MEQWEYLARNLKKIMGPGLESDFNRLGPEGWEFVAVAKDYAIFKRRKQGLALLARPLRSRLCGLGSTAAALLRERLNSLACIDGPLP